LGKTNDEEELQEPKEAPSSPRNHEGEKYVANLSSLEDSKRIASESD